MALCACDTPNAAMAVMHIICCVLRADAIPNIETLILTNNRLGNLQVWWGQQRLGKSTRLGNKCHTQHSHAAHHMIHEALVSCCQLATHLTGVPYSNLHACRMM